LFDVKRGQVKEVEHYISIIQSKELGTHKHRHNQSQRGHSSGRERQVGHNIHDQYSLRHYRKDSDADEDDFEQVKQMFAHNIQAQVQQRLQTMEEEDEEEETYNKPKEVKPSRSVQVIQVLGGQRNR
jgi:hypothetical protein